jgi:hypothetical protein
MSKKVAILQSNYIPWKGYFDLIRSVDEFIFYDEMQYTKNDWRNRNKIKSPNGLHWLTIPVRQHNLQQRIDETETFRPDWAKTHLETIKQFYRKAPFFQPYKAWLEDLYQSGTSTNLSQINFHFISRICETLGIQTKLSWSHDYGLIEGKSERLVDLVKKAHGTTYLSGPAAKSYLDESLFEAEGISVRWMDYSGYPEYPQLYPPFEHGVSVIDLILNTGTDARNFLKPM